MRENGTTSYRGTNYEIGRGDRFYGIWAAGAPRSLPPLEWWPETAEGWSAAWSRFTAIEAPGSIIHAGGPGARWAAPGPGWGPAGPGPQRGTPAPGPQGGAPASGRRSGNVIAAGLLFLGVVCGLAGLFPGYVGGQSLASQADELVPHLIYLAAWTASAVLILRGGTWSRAGALIGSGVSVVTLGLFLADVGQKIAGSTAGAGLWLGLTGWLACTAGAGYAWRISRAGAPARPRGRDVGPMVLVLLAGIGTAIAFAPSWDSYVLRTATGASASITAGNAFANPGAVIAGNVITMVALVAVAVAASLWRPVRYGGLLLAGALVPLVAQAISALVQLAQSPSPELFGISPAQAAQEGLTISNGLTAAFWIYCVFVVALAAACGWMFLTPDARGLEMHRGGPAFPAGWWGPGVPGPMAAPGFPAGWAAPGATQPATTQLAVAQPATTQPAATEPAAAQPAVGRPAATDEAPTDEAATHEGATEPASPDTAAAPAQADTPTAAGQPSSAEEGEAGGSAD